MKVTDENVPTLFDNEDIICEAFDVPENKTMLVNAVLEICRQEAGERFWNGGIPQFQFGEYSSRFEEFLLLRRWQTAPVPGAGLMAPRVGVVARHEANMITRLILGEEDA
ncbi:MAG: hypothetical protein ACLS6O_08860 [Bifidobacterium sp.]